MTQALETLVFSTVWVEIASRSSATRPWIFSPLSNREDLAWRNDTLRPWRERKPLAGHEGWVKAVAFSPDGKLVLTGSSDNTARLWDAAGGKLVATLSGHERSVNAVTFSPDGKLVLTGS